MSETIQVHTVRLEPVGIDMEVAEDETVLDAAFRQGISLMHGCRHGQCSTCKAVVHDDESDFDMLPYSTFALNNAEREQGNVLLCRMMVYEDCEIELLNFDEDLLKHSIPVQHLNATVTEINALTHDMWQLIVEVDENTELAFLAGQYADITLPQWGIQRSFSMANAPSESKRLEFIIKSYSDGAFSAKLAGDISVGDSVKIEAPYGSCVRREEIEDTMYLIGGGSGMAPLLSILRDLVESGEQRAVRFFYGARTQADLFYEDEIRSLGERLNDFEYIPALSHAEEDNEWTGERGFVHDVVNRYLSEHPTSEGEEAYTCGPPPMIDAVIPVLEMNDIDEENIHSDKFTLAVSDE